MGESVCIGLSERFSKRKHAFIDLSRFQKFHLKMKYAISKTEIAAERDKKQNSGIIILIFKFTTAMKGAECVWQGRN